MENKSKIEIEKVKIPDVRKAESVTELSEKEQDQIAGGGAGYGYSGNENS